LGMTITDIDRSANQILNGTYQLKGRVSSMTSSELLWDFLKQSKPGYAAIIMNKK